MNFPYLDKVLFVKINSIIYVVGIFFILHFLFDFINKLDYTYGLNFPKFNRILKGILLGFSIIVSCYFALAIQKNIKKQIFILYALAFILFGLKVVSFGNFETFIRYSFFIGILPLFSIVNSYPSVYEKYNLRIYSIFKVISIINFLAILTGFFLQLDIFSTYHISRFGFIGLIMNQMQAPYFYISALFIFYRNKNITLLILIIISILFSGVKAAYFGLFIFLLFFVNYFGGLNKNYLKRISYTIVLSIIFTTILYFILQTSVFRKIINDEGIISAVFSFRDINLSNILNAINSENFNFFFGTISLDSYRSEFGFLDIFFFFGLFGLLFYGLLLKELFIQFVNNKLAFSYYMITFIIVALAGNFFYFPFNGFIFITTLIFLSNWSKENF